MNKPRFFEFFAGGGMARAGLGEGWDCAFANDFDHVKAATYEANWGRKDFYFGDVNDITVAMLPGYADLVWASFPCQDLSLAGNAAGLGTEQQQTRSGAFWAFWRLMKQLRQQARGPSLIVLENVYGVLTSNGGRDFATIGRELALEGYVLGALRIDAVRFVPQSRPRVFIVAIREGLTLPARFFTPEPDVRWHPPAMAKAIERLAEPDREQWRWLTIDDTMYSRTRLDDLIEAAPQDVRWHTPRGDGTTPGHDERSQ